MSSPGRALRNPNGGRAIYSAAGRMMYRVPVPCIFWTGFALHRVVKNDAGAYEYHPLFVPVPASFPPVITTINPSVPVTWSYKIGVIGYYYDHGGFVTYNTYSQYVGATFKDDAWRVFFCTGAFAADHPSEANIDAGMLYSSDSGNATGTYTFLSQNGDYSEITISGVRVEML